MLFFVNALIYDLFRNVDPGNITKQLELRKKLNCKPFKWYKSSIHSCNSLFIVFFCNRFMENVAFDLPQYYPPIPLPPYAKGEVQMM